MFYSVFLGQLNKFTQLQSCLIVNRDPFYVTLSWLIADPRSLHSCLHLLCPAAPKTQKLLKPQPRKVVLVSIQSVLLVHIY